MHTRLELIRLHKIHMFTMHSIIIFAPKINFPSFNSSIGNLAISPVMLSAQVADFSNYSLALGRRRANMTFDVQVC